MTIRTRGFYDGSTIELIATIERYCTTGTRIADDQGRRLVGATLSGMIGINHTLTLHYASDSNCMAHASVDQVDQLPTEKEARHQPATP